MPSHEDFLRQAIALARKAAIEYSTGGVFGAVIVKDQRVVAEGMNRVVASHDPTWHAEMEAIRLACVTLRSFKLTGCVMYTAGESCPMCLSASYWAGIEKIYYAATVADALKYGNFDDTFIFEQLALSPEKRSIPSEQLLQEECVEVWKEYHAKADRIQY
ncbi:MAG: nucleoside deaminase [Planctomycetota bacterium]